MCLSDAPPSGREFPAAYNRRLQKAGYDVAWARTDCPGMKDAAILDRAEAEGRILLTLDKDFWQIGIQRQSPLQQSGVILFRVHPAIPENVTPLVLRTMASGQEWRGHASTVTADRVLTVRLAGSKKR